jgi:hypothetical protein
MPPPPPPPPPPQPARLAASATAETIIIAMRRIARSILNVRMPGSMVAAALMENDELPTECR